MSDPLSCGRKGNIQSPFCLITRLCAVKTMIIEERLKALGIDLPESYSPIANYIPVSRVGNTLYLSGTGPSRGAAALYTGKLGSDISVDDAYQAARLAAVNVLIMLKQELGDLDKVDRIVKMIGYINCTPDFQQQPVVLNGASDLFVQVFGEKGRHARAAIGINGLPMSLPVEIDVTVTCKD